MRNRGARISAAEKDVISKLLWLSIRTVVVLKEVWRQKINKDDDADQVSRQNRFVDLLQRLRKGKCDESDYQLLCSRLVSNVQPNWSAEKWKETPLIASQNETKDVLNNAATIAFARRTGRQVHWYYAVDRHDGRELTDPDLLHHLRNLNSSVTNYRLGKLPLVVGMPVMMAINFDVEGGVVNGSAGILKSIRYWVDDRGDTLPTLQELDAVAISDEKTIRFQHPASGRKCTIKRTQLPIMPAFAMTAHKAQGLTLPSALIDLESCRGSESPYVMISRVKSLDDLLIMRPFRIERITRRMSEDVRREFIRLAMLELLTLVDNGSEAEAREARNSLKSRGLAELIGQEYTDIDIENVQFSRLNTQQQELSQLTGRFEKDAIVTRSKKRMRRPVVDSPGEPTVKRHRMTWS